MYPSLYSNSGVYESDFFEPRSEAEVSTACHMYVHTYVCVYVTHTLFIPVDQGCICVCSMVSGSCVALFVYVCYITRLCSLGVAAHRGLLSDLFVEAVRHTLYTTKQHAIANSGVICVSSLHVTGHLKDTLF